MAKCWTKISDTKYVNKKRHGTLYIFDGRKVNIEIDRVKLGRSFLPQTHIHEEFKPMPKKNWYDKVKTNPKAIKFAKAYMKNTGCSAKDDLDWNARTKRFGRVR